MSNELIHGMNTTRTVGYKAWNTHVTAHKSKNVQLSAIVVIIIR